MAFRVEISPSALTDIETTVLWLQQETPETADDWYSGLVEAVISLENLPNRHLQALKRLLEEDFRDLLPRGA